MSDLKDDALKNELKEDIKIFDNVQQPTPPVKIKKVKNTPKHYRKKPLWRNPDIKDVLYFD